MRLRNVKTNIAAATVLFGSCAALPHVTSTEKTHLSSVNDEDLSQDSAVLDSQITVEDSEQATDEAEVPLKGDTSEYQPSRIMLQFKIDLGEIILDHISDRVSQQDGRILSLNLCGHTHYEIAKAQDKILRQICELFQREDSLDSLVTPFCKKSDPSKISQCVDSEDVSNCIESNTDLTSGKAYNRDVLGFARSKSLTETYANCKNTLYEQDEIYVKLSRLFKRIVLEKLNRIKDLPLKEMDGIKKRAEDRERFLGPLRKDIFNTH